MLYGVLNTAFSSIYLTLIRLVSTERSYILKQTCSWKLKVCLSMYDFSVDIWCLTMEMCCWVGVSHLTWRTVRISLAVLLKRWVCGNWLRVWSLVVPRKMRYRLRYPGTKGFSNFRRFKGQKVFTSQILLNPFVPNAPFLSPLQISENLKVFRG